MTLYGFVDKVEGNMCAVCLADESCGHDCSACAGCSRKTAGRVVMAENALGAVVGDRVTIHAPEKTVIAAAFLVFLLPVALTVVGYAVGKYVLTGWYFALLGALLGLGAGLLICRAYNRALKKKADTVYKVESILTPEEEEKEE